jgi:hypothetical protein
MLYHSFFILYFLFQIRTILDLAQVHDFVNELCLNEAHSIVEVGANHMGHAVARHHGQMPPADPDTSQISDVHDDET